MLSTKLWEKSVGKMKQMRLLAVLLVPAVALIMGAAVTHAWEHGGSVIEYEDAECGFEANLTDFDTGLWAAVDAIGWRWLQIYLLGENYWEKKLLFSTWTAGNLRRLGLTELRFESREPEESFQDILDMFPEGECKFIGKTINGDYLKSKADLSHEFACGAQGIVFTSNETEIDPEFDCVPTDEDLVVSWEEIDSKLTAVNGEDDFECEDPLGDEEIEAIEVFVEAENQEIFFNLPGEATEVVVPASFLEGIEMEEELPKVEILVVLGSNKSIREFEFMTCPSE
jgi:hypothetical protein